MLDSKGDVITRQGRVEVLNDVECREFPWHPKPVLELTDSNAVQLNEGPCLVLFVGMDRASLLWGAGPPASWARAGHGAGSPPLVLTESLGRDLTSTAVCHHCVLAEGPSGGKELPVGAPQDRFGAFPVAQQLTGVCQSLLCPRGSHSSHTTPWGAVQQGLAAQRSCRNKGVVVAVDRNGDEVLGV